MLCPFLFCINAKAYYIILVSKCLINETGGRYTLVFSSTVFLFLFLPLVVLIYYNPFFKSRKFKNVFLLLVSLGFYAWGEPLFVFLMILSIIVGWYAGLKIDNISDVSNKKKILFVSAGFHIFVLFVFKYLTFTAQQLGLLFNQDYSWINIVLPIGISFFTFQLLSYLFDIYYGKAHAQRNILNAGLYIALFPQLIAGPIVRYDTIEQQIMYRKESIDEFCEGMQRFIYGLAKKVLIADYMAVVADNIFDTHINLSVATAWLGAIAYTLQIYFDFSGYSDMAIGLGRMFGFKFNENFNYPYIAKSVTDFWRRWHISLSSWFRDYVYIPLGGNRVGSIRWIINIFAVWALTGIWHGANWTFLCWGLMYFALLIFEKYTKIQDKLGILSHVYTMVMVIIAWTVFRAESLEYAREYIGYMLGINANSLYDKMFIYYLDNIWIIMLIACIFSLPVCDKIVSMIEQKTYGIILKPLITTVLFIQVILVVIGASYSPFIYFNF